MTKKYSNITSKKGKYCLLNGWMILRYITIAKNEPSVDCFIYWATNTSLNLWIFFIFINWIRKLCSYCLPPKSKNKHIYQSLNMMFQIFLPHSNEVKTFFKFGSSILLNFHLLVFKVRMGPRFLKKGKLKYL